MIMRQIIALIMILLCISCATTQRHDFLARKHKITNNDIKIIWESKPQLTYSPFFDLKVLNEKCGKGITMENYDSLQYAYLQTKNETSVKPNCFAYDVRYKINDDTINRKIYFIEERLVHIIHDEDIIHHFSEDIERNLLIFDFYRVKNLNDFFTNDTINTYN